jgi:hypothetical protein
MSAKNKNRGKVLIVATEPWEVRLAVELTKVFKKSIEIDLVVADHYTPFYHSEFLRKLELQENVHLKTMEKEFLAWQRKRPEIDETMDRRFESWRKTCTQRTLQQVINSHQGLNGYENAVTYFSLSPEWRKKIVHDYLEFAERLLDEEITYRIISLSRRSLLANLLWEYSRHREIPYLTIIQSRVGNRLIVRDDFGYGVRHVRGPWQGNDGSSAQNFLKKWDEKHSLYKSWTSKQIDVIVDHSTKPFRTFFEDLERLLRRTWARIFYEYPMRRNKIRRMGESLFRLTIFELKRAYRKLILGVFPKLFFKSDLPATNFFLWMLHARPEDSTTVLGNGEDEVAVLYSTLTVIKAHAIVVVKENAQMYGVRPLSFYRNLRKLGVWLISPTFENADLFNKTDGVIGISGTVLLEAKLLGLPSFAFGHPEFLNALDNHCSSNLDEFVRNIYITPATRNNKLAEQYIAWILDLAPEDHLELFEGEWFSESGKITLKNIQLQIGRFWNDILETSQDS